MLHKVHNGIPGVHCAIMLPGGPTMLTKILKRVHPYTHRMLKQWYPDGGIGFLDMDQVCDGGGDVLHKDLAA